MDADDSKWGRQGEAHIPVLSCPAQAGHPVAAAGRNGAMTAPKQRRRWLLGRPPPGTMTANGAGNDSSQIAYSAAAIGLPLRRSASASNNSSAAPAITVPGGKMATAPARLSAS